MVSINFGDSFNYFIQIITDIGTLIIVIGYVVLFFVVQYYLIKVYILIYKYIVDKIHFVKTSFTFDVGTGIHRKENKDNILKIDDNKLNKNSNI